MIDRKENHELRRIAGSVQERKTHSNTVPLVPVVPVIR